MGPASLVTIEGNTERRTKSGWHRRVVQRSIRNRHPHAGNYTRSIVLRMHIHTYSYGHVHTYSVSPYTIHGSMSTEHGSTAPWPMSAACAARTGVVHRAKVRSGQGLGRNAAGCTPRPFGRLCCRACRRESAEGQRQTCRRGCNTWTLSEEELLLRVETLLHAHYSDPPQYTYVCMYAAQRSSEAFACGSWVGGSMYVPRLR